MASLYIAVFILLVVIQFPSAGPVTALAGGVSFKGLPASDGKGIRSAELGANGLRLVFSERYPLSLRNAAGKDRTALPVSYESRDNGFLVKFDDGTTISVSGDDDGRASWRLSPKGAAASATIRYELAYGAALLAPDDDGSLRLSLGGSTYRITGIQASADAGGEARGNAKTLTLSATKGVLRPFVAVRESEGKTAAPAQFIAQAPMEPAAWSKEISDWREKAWSAFSGPAFDAAAGTWAPTAGTPGSFDETTFAAYMAEAMRRGRVADAAALVSVVRTAHADGLSWKSAPFAGRTATSMAAFEEANLAEVKAVERLVQSRSASLFYKKGVVALLFDRSPYSLAQEAMSLARTADFSKADAAQSVALIEAYLDARNYLSEEENPFSRAVEQVDRTVSPAIRKADGGFFLETGADGRCDALTGLQAGEALIRLADAVGKPIYAGIGQSLVTSLVRLAAADGSMPASVTVAGGSAIQSDERLSAAVAYPVIAESEYYPKAVSFYKQLGPGAWAWTCVPGIRAESKPGETVFTADYPVGSSHYLTLYGVKPYVKIQLYGLDYNMDAGFENYNASGYFYKKTAGAMYLKMRHKARGEEIRLFY